MRTSVRLLSGALLALALSACSDADDPSLSPADDVTADEAGDATFAEDESMTTGEADVDIDDGTPEPRDVSLEARVTRWTDTALRIDYTIANTGALELIVFDVGDATTTAIDEEGRITLFQAKRDTGETDFAEAPTIGGRNLSPGQTLEGTASRSLPIRIDFVAPLVGGLVPDTLEFCIGFGNADDIIPTTRADGTYPLNVDLDLQSLVCTTLERP